MAFVSFLIKLLILSEFIPNPYYQFTLNMHGPDQNFFAKWAENIGSGSWTWERVPEGQPFYIAPLYSLLISWSLRYTSNPMMPIHLLQALLSSSCVWLLYRMGRLVAAPRAGLIAGFLWAFYGVSMFYDACLIRASLCASLTGIILYLVILNYNSTVSYRLSGFIGFTTGILCLIRPTVLLVLIPLLMITSGVIKSDRKRILSSLFMTLIMIITVSPATIRNFAVSGKPVLISSQGADAILLGNDPTGPGVGHSPTKLSSELKIKSQNNPAKSAALIAELIQQSPAAFGRLYLRKVRMIMNAYEVPANYNYYAFKKLIPVSRLGFVEFWFIIPFAVIGLIVPARNTGVRIAKIFVAAVLLPALAVHIQSRYRFPAIIPLVLMSSIGIHHILAWLSEHRIKQLIGSVALASCVALYAAPYPSYGIRHVTDLSGKRRLLDQNIQPSDAVTVLMSFLLTPSSEAYSKEIAWIAEYGNRHFGVSFWIGYRTVSEKLLESINNGEKKESVRKALSQMSV